MRGGARAGRMGGAADPAVAGGRVGAFVVFADENGVRCALRPGAVLALSDGDEARDTTVVQCAGGRAVRIPAPLDEVLRWFV